MINGGIKDRIGLSISSTHLAAAKTITATRNDASTGRTIVRDMNCHVIRTPTSTPSTSAASNPPHAGWRRSERPPHNTA